MKRADDGPGSGTGCGGRRIDRVQVSLPGLGRPQGGFRVGDDVVDPLGEGEDGLFFTSCDRGQGRSRDKSEEAHGRKGEGGELDHFCLGSGCP